MDADDDTIESAKPPKPPKSHDPERRKRFLLHAVAVVAVATAAFTGLTAWEIHQDRVNSKAFYCFFATAPGGPPRVRRSCPTNSTAYPARQRHGGSGTCDTH